MTPTTRLPDRARPLRPCPNCGDPAPGFFCPTCGQRKVDVRVSVWSMLREVLDDQLSLNSALPRTLAALFLQPGKLTEEYVRGRIVRYVPPFRLYLMASIAYFVTLALVGETGAFEMGSGDDPGRDAPVSVRIDGQEVAGVQDATVEQDAAPGEDAPIEQDAAPGEDTAPAEAAPVEQDAAPGADTGPGEELAPEVEAGAPEGARAETDWLTIAVDEDDIAIVAWGKRRLLRLNELGPEEAVRAIGEGVQDRLPTGMFLLVPAFALLLGLAYRSRRRYYVEHFVFALHVHAAGFLLMTLSALAEALFLAEWIGGVTLLLIMHHLFVALRRIYKGSRTRTALRMLFLLMSYGTALVVVLAGALLFTVLLL